MALLEIENLEVGFNTEAGLLHEVDRVSFTLGPGRTLRLIGESGCGKSVTATSILGLVPSSPGCDPGMPTALRSALDKGILYRVADPM